LRKDGNLDINKIRKINYSVAELYCIYHNIENKKCECGKSLKLKSFKKGFMLFCSPACQKKSRKTIEKSNKTKSETKNMSKSMKKVWEKRTKEDKEKISDSIKKTNLEKYGFECVLSSKEIRDKIKKTNLEKYGVECILSSNMFKDKIKKTNIEKYGEEYVLSSKEIRDKIKKTNLEKYGVEYVLSSEKVIKENVEKTKKTNIKNDRWVSPSKKSDWELYKLLVGRETERQYKKFKHILNPLNEKRGHKTKQIDHKISKKFGFSNNIPVYIISSYHNLELIDAKENKLKSSRCSISLEDLLSKVYI